MAKKIFLSCLWAVGFIIQGHLSPAAAQSAPAPQPQQARPAGVPDDLHLILMIKNAILALNQANMTGNYSVLRDMGTPNFQITNSSARLAEVFATLRGRKVDLSPILFFTPKLNAPPALLDGQVLRLAGFFPTTPEQVNFELAFQLFADQWMLAGIAVNTAPAGESPQASAAPAQPSQSADSGGGPAKPGEAKPIRIDLSQPTQPAAQPAAAKKEKPAAKKPAKPSTQHAATAKPAEASPKPAEAEPKPDKPVEKPAESGSSWNPFAH